ncbi:MAG: DUF5103 domain-containing protein [Bacteroidetes bacterium]|nr:MAG: DUF5103 domain-containing protein [Bacteroidota bacterium]
MQTLKPLFRILTPKSVIYFYILLAFLSSFFSPLQALNRNNSLIAERQTELNETTEFQPPGSDYYEDDYLRYSDFVYVNNIKSVLFNRKGWELSPPIIEFNSAEQLILRFDDLDADFKNYAYTIVHCDAMWQPSGLMEYEYIEGFYEDRISEYSFSINTRVPFSHYSLEFPNPNMKPKLSGNYLLKVFIDGNREDVVLTRRFMVFEQRVTIDATVKQATNLNYRDTKQEIDFSVNTSLYPISNPYRDLKVLITQNGRWDNAIYGLQPRLVQGNMLIYDYEDRNLFQGGNEFRNFDTKSLRHRSLNIEEINAISNGWEVRLRPDRNRRFLRYTTRDDINGRFLIKTEDYSDDLLESDYAWVYFVLPHNNPLPDGNIYVMGALTDWIFSSRNKMEYNYRDSRYELRLLLKQGFYDYQYIYLEDGTDVGDESVFEGTHSITENDYTIYIYYRKPGDIYDSLIGIQHINSGI